MTEVKGPIQALRNRQFRTIWLAALLSNMGALVHLVAAAWWMTVASGSEAMVALVQSAITLPVVVMSLLAGALADSYERRRIMMTAQLLMLAISTALTLLAIVGYLTPWMLLGFTFLLGCGTALHNPSWQSSIGSLVPRDELPAAVAANAMGMNVTRSIGPAIGGAIVVSFGTVAAFAVNAASYLFLIFALLRWNFRQEPRRLPPEDLGAAIATGLRYFAMSPNLMNCAFRACIFGFAVISFQALAPLIARDRLQGDAMIYGILLCLFGTGAIIGGLLSPQLRSRLRTEQVCRLTFLLAAACCAIVAWSADLVVTGAAFLLAGACWINTFPLINATVQLASPRWVLGRTLSLFMTGAFGGMALGSWVWGAVMETYGLSAAMFGCCGIFAVGTLWGLRFPLPEISFADNDPVRSFKEPPLQVDLSRRSGPIKISVNYQIANDDSAEFLRSMAERRRLRVRDGARNWELFRDVERPEYWTECYHFATWTEYIRHHERRTGEDVANIERVRQLHRGPDPIRATRLLKVPTTARFEAGLD